MLLSILHQVKNNKDKHTEKIKKLFTNYSNLQKAHAMPTIPLMPFAKVPPTRPPPNPKLTPNQERKEQSQPPISSSLQRISSGRWSSFVPLTSTRHHKLFATGRGPRTCCDSFLLAFCFFCLYASLLATVPRPITSPTPTRLRKRAT